MSNPIVSVNNGGLTFSDSGYGRAKTLSAYVCTPDRKIKCRVRGITSFDIAVKGFNDFSSISFSVSKHVTNQSTYLSEVNEAYDYLHAFCLIYIPEFGDYGYFLINTEPEINARGRLDENKNFTVESYESILQYENLVDFAVNMGTTGSLEMFDENLDALEIPQENIVLYNPDNPKLSLLNLVLTDDYYGWEVGDVDEELRSMERSFEVSSQNVYSFLCYDVSKAFQCIFTFDTVNLLINCHSIKTVGENTNIYLSLDHFLSEVDIAPQTDYISTVFKVKGGNDLGIEAVNFGSDKIVNIDYPVQMIGTELASKYNTYKTYRDVYRNQYSQDMQDYYNEILVEQAILDRQPDDIIYNNWSSTIYYPTEDLQNYLNVYEEAVEIIEEIYTNEATGTVDLVKLNKSEHASLYHSYKDVCIPDIKAELKKRSQGTSYDPVNADVIWELYGLNDLQLKYDSYQTLCDTLVEQGYSANTWNPASTISQDTFNAHHQEYLLYQQYLSQLSALIASKTADVQASQLRQNQLLDDMEALAERSKMEYYIGTIFTQDDVQSITSLYRESDYQNENILTTEIDTIVTSVEKANDLLLDARDRLEIESVPQLSWSVSSANLFAMKDFAPLRDQLQVGSFVNLYYGGQLYDPTAGTFTNGQTLKFRVTEIDFDGINFDGNFQLVFSNMTATKMFRNDFENILNTMISSRTNSIVNTASTAANATASNVATTLLRPYIETLSAKIADSGIDRSDVINLHAFDAEIENLMADYLTAHTAEIFHLYVDVIESDDGKSWWNLRTGELCLNGYMINTEVEYAAGTLDTAPTTGWATTYPILTPQTPYTWMRTKMTFDGDPPTVLTSAAARITGEKGADGQDGESPITVQIDSTGGTIFKNSNISSILTARVLQGNEDITNQVARFRWYRRDANGNIDDSWTRIYTGNSIAISADDVNGKATFYCEAQFE